MEQGPTQAGSEPPWVDVLDSAPFPSHFRKITFQNKDSSGWSRRKVCSCICSLPSAWQEVLSLGQFVSSEGSVPAAGLWSAHCRGVGAQSRLVVDGCKELQPQPCWRLAVCSLVF